MALPVNVTPLSEGRALAQERVTYRAADGKQKETYLGIPSSLLPRLYEASLAEFRLLLYVWQRTGGWKGYHNDPQPVRITFAEWMGGRPGYAQDTGAHLCKQEVADTRDALVARGWLYEEWETPHERGPRRYALVAPEHPGVGPGEREDGQWEVLLLTSEGPHSYVIPESVLQRRKEGETFLLSRRATFLDNRKASPGLQESVVLESRKEKTRRSFPGARRVQPITNVLTNASTQIDLAKRDTPPYGGAVPRIIDEDTSRTSERRELSSLNPLPHAATTQEHQLREHLTRQQDTSDPSEQESAAEPLGSAVGAAPAALNNKQALFPIQPLEDPLLHPAAARAGKHARRPRAEPAPNAGADTPEAQAAFTGRSFGPVSRRRSS